MDAPVLSYHANINIMLHTWDILKQWTNKNHLLYNIPKKRFHNLCLFMNYILFYIRLFKKGGAGGFSPFGC